MTDEDVLADRLLDWEDAAEVGRAVTAAELCPDRPDLVAELQRRIDRLGRVGWVDRPAGAGVLAVGAEPVPGFRLVAPLGRGGTGEVWKAAGPGGFAVALKFLPRGGKAARDELRALDALRRVRHPHLLALVGAWEAGDWLALGSEVADGSLQDLRQARAAAGKKGLPPGEALGYFLGAAAALDHLHAAGVFHRDVKPQNLLLVGGVVKVADFGLTRPSEQSETAHTGGMTADYAAPEVFDGRAHRSSDQYALAVSYCVLRGGRGPFAGTPAQVMRGHLDAAPDLTMLPALERPPVARALAKDPAARWPSCATFVRAVYAARGKSVPATSPATPRTGSGLSVPDVLCRALASSTAGDTAEALSILGLAARLDPDDGGVNLTLCLSRLKACDVRGAREACSRVPDGGMLAPILRLYLALVSCEVGCFAEARTDCDAAFSGLAAFRKAVLTAAGGRGFLPAPAAGALSGIDLTDPGGVAHIISAVDGLRGVAEHVRGTVSRLAARAGGAGTDWPEDGRVGADAVGDAVSRQNMSD